MAEKNGWIIKWLVGSLWGLLVIAITTIGTNVIANDQNSRDRDDNLKADVSVVKADIREIKTAQKYIQKTVDSMHSEQKEALNDIKQMIRSFHS